MLYENLIDQYNQLTEEEKNALLIYKSRLGRAINALGNNEDELIEIYNRYKKIIDNPQNIFLKLAVFKDISFNDEISFKESLVQILNLVKQATHKIFLPENTWVYRVVSVPIDENLTIMAKGDLVSTSLDINECEKFLISGLGMKYKHYIYKIHLEKNSIVGICPYAILFDESQDRIILTQKQDQKEIILSKNEYLFNEMAKNTKLLDNGENLTVITIDAKMKEQQLLDMPKNI